MFRIQSVDWRCVKASGRLSTAKTTKTSSESPGSGPIWSSVDGGQNDRRTVAINSLHRSSDQTSRTPGCCTATVRLVAQRFQLIGFLATKYIPVSPRPPCSPDSSPRDFFLFSRLKIRLEERHFRTLQNIQTSATDRLTEGRPSIRVPALLYEQWKHRLQRCADSQGNYSEGDNVK